MCRLHERKLQRLQQEEEAELVAQRERELELQVRSTLGILGTSARRETAAPAAKLSQDQMMDPGAGTAPAPCTACREV